MTLCGYGGWCTRAPGHKGTHTADPPPSTKRWDRRHEIDHLDFPTPAWALEVLQQRLAADDDDEVTPEDVGW